MAQNLDWDASTGRIRGVNEVTQADQAYPQRLVYGFYPTARPISAVRLRNVKSDKCISDGAVATQWSCDASDTAHAWIGYTP